jgi:hypothetical protein
MSGEVNPSAANAQRVVADNGETVTVRRIASSASLDVATGKVVNDTPTQEFEVIGAFRDFNTDEINGGSIQIGDSILMIAAMAIDEAEGFVPANGDTILANDDEYEVLRVIKVRRAGFMIAYDLHIRGAGEVVAP